MLSEFIRPSIKEGLFEHTTLGIEDVSGGRVHSGVAFLLARKWWVAYGGSFH